MLGCLFCYMVLLVLALVCVLLVLKSAEVMLSAAVLMMLPARHYFLKHCALVAPINLGQASQSEC